LKRRLGALLTFVAFLILTTTGCQARTNPPSSPVEPPQTPADVNGPGTAPPGENESPLQPADTGAGAATPVPTSSPSSTMTSPLAVDAATPEEPLTATGGCKFEYFFEPSPAACPLGDPLPSWAAEQPFEGGLLTWLEEINGGPIQIERTIIAFYDDGHWAAFDDTWTPEQPDRDPNITPPEGLYQPVRGFGKLWREDTALHQQLGWATKPEIGYDTLWQWQWQTDGSPASVAFLRTLANGVIRVEGWARGSGTWETVAP
jgi:hypothetical protein